MKQLWKIYFLAVAVMLGASTSVSAATEFEAVSAQQRVVVGGATLLMPNDWHIIPGTHDLPDGAVAVMAPLGDLNKFAALLGCPGAMNGLQWSAPVLPTEVFKKDGGFVTAAEFVAAGEGIYGGSFATIRHGFELSLIAKGTSVREPVHAFLGPVFDAAGIPGARGTIPWSPEYVKRRWDSGWNVRNDTVIGEPGSGRLMGMFLVPATEGETDLTTLDLPLAGFSTWALIKGGTEIATLWAMNPDFQHKGIMSGADALIAAQQWQSLAPTVEVDVTWTKPSE